MNDTVLFAIIAAIGAMIGMASAILVDLCFGKPRMVPRAYFALNWWRIGLGYLGITGVFFWILYIPFQLTYLGR